MKPISLARGVPSPDLLPAREIASAAQRALERDPAGALSYGAAEGYKPLRDWFAARYDVNHPCVAAHLKMHELFERRLLFSTGDVSRWQFFSHIRDSNRLYRPVWSRAYSVFKAACAPLALLLGYRAYGTVSRLYARSPLRKLRERVIDQWLKEP